MLCTKVSKQSVTDNLLILTYYKLNETYRKQINQYASLYQSKRHTYRKIVMLWWPE